MNFPTDYDLEVTRIIPHYKTIQNEVIDIISTVNSTPKRWLNTGCGTSGIIKDNIDKFCKTDFILADPSVQMLKMSKNKFSKNNNIAFINSNTQGLALDSESADVITALFCHHYLNKDERIAATENCFRMLKSNGIYIFTENIDTFSPIGHNIAFNRWKRYQLNNKRTADDVSNHLNRYNTEYFPLTLPEHFNLLKNVGFSVIEVFWYSYSQVGIYCIK